MSTRHSFRSIVAALLVALAPAAVMAQGVTQGQVAQPLVPTAVPPPVMPAGPPPVPKTNRSRDYVIGPGDTLSFGVFGLPEFAQVSRVSNSGKIHLTSLGILTASGKTIAGLESEVAGLLRERELVKEPWVIVQVTESRAHPVYLLGEVMTPGQFQITDEMYLNDLITLGQGFNDVATPVGYLYRRKGDTTPTGVEEETNDGMYAIPIDFNAVQTGLRPDLNLKLQGGDILYVPQRRPEYYFVIGEVASPGLLEMKRGQKLRLTQAVAQAGGLSRLAKASKIMLVRYAEDNSREELEINFKKVLSGDVPDPELRFGDVIYVPGSKAKSAGLAFASILPGVAQQRVIAR